MKKANGNTHHLYSERSQCSKKRALEKQCDERMEKEIFVITNKHVPKETQNNQLLQVHLNQSRVNPEPKKPNNSEKPGKILGFLPNTGTTVSIVLFSLCFGKHCSLLF